MTFKLERDNAADAWAARSAGWSIYGDDWWWRERKPGDIDIDVTCADDASHFGFTMSDRVCVRSAAYALAYDRKEITPWA